MQDRIALATQQVTSVALIATALLLAPAFAGLGPSIPLAAAAAALGGVAFVYRDRLLELSDREWLVPHLTAVPAGPLVAAVVMLAFLEATPAELKTLGSVIGLFGMANYLLRPIYFFLGMAVARLAGVGSR